MPYLGDLQNGMSVYVVNDTQYKKLQLLGEVLYLYNYKFEDPENLDASVPYLRSLAKEDPDRFVGVNLIRTEDKEGAWVRVMYSLCVFMFATLTLACGSIIFIKLNNEAAEDMERYRVLQKIGIQRSTLYKSMKNGIRFTYCCPFVLMVLLPIFYPRSGTVIKVRFAPDQCVQCGNHTAVIQHHLPDIRPRIQEKSFGLKRNKISAASRENIRARRTFFSIFRTCQQLPKALPYFPGIVSREYPVVKR